MDIHLSGRKQVLFHNDLQNWTREIRDVLEPE